MAFKFKKTRVVTLPTFKLKTGDEYFFKFETPMELGKEIKNSTMGRATVLRGLNLETGEQGIIICRQILMNELNEQYPGESYVGKCFSVSLYKVPEKRWTGVNLAEVADPTDDPEWQSQVAIEAARRKSEAQGIDPDTGEIDPEDQEPEDEDEDAEVSVSAPAPKATRSAPAKKSGKGRR